MGDILSTVGVFCTVLDTMITVGVILSTEGILSTMGGYHEYLGGGGVQCLWVDTILCNLSTVGGYHDTCGGVQNRGVLKQQKNSPPPVLGTPP